MKEKLDFILKDSYNDPDLAKLKLFFFLLIIFSLFLTSCGYEVDTTLIDNCLNSEYLSLSDPSSLEGMSILCAGTESTTDPHRPVYSSKGDFPLESSNKKKVINQMYANLFLYLDADKGFGEDLEDKDMIDAAAIAADCLFGNCDDNNRHSGTMGLGYGDGFVDDRNPDGMDDIGSDSKDGATAYGHSVTSFRFNVDKFKDFPDAFGSAFGLEDVEVTGIKDKGLNYVPAMYICLGQDGLGKTDSEGVFLDGTDDENAFFDIYPGSQSPDGDVVYQIIDLDCGDEEIDCSGTKKSVLAFVCEITGEDTGRWVPFSEYMNDPDYDNDNDGAPGSFIMALDCDDNNPNVFPDLSIFFGFEGIVPTDICGDEVDNLCHESEIYTIFEDVYESHGITNHLEDYNDDCDTNPVACETNCLKKDDSCDFLGQATPDQTDVDYDNLETGDGYCCGADQAADIGTIKDLDGTDQICLSSESNIIGSNDLDNLVECGSDGYCWVNPSNAEYKIFTIKQYGQDPYDVVSNSNSWYFCENSYIGDSLPTSTTNGREETSLRFKCFDQGDRTSWAECVSDNYDPIYNEGIKRRRAGDGLYLLADNLGSPNSGLRLGTSIDDTTGENTNNNNYGEYYKTDLIPNNLDFTDYDFLEFYVQFGSSASYPANVELTIFGPNNGGEETIYFKQNTLGFAVNSPQVDGDNNTIHIKIPIEEWINVELIKFKSTGDNNELSIKNVYLSKNNSDPDICSGFETAEDDLTSWITDLDFSQSNSDAIGRDICKTYYGNSAWFGHSDLGEGEVSDDSASCCGDDPNEYYAGKTAEGDNRGCFNGEVVRNDDTMMNIEYSVDYQMENHSVEYPPVDFEVDMSFTSRYLQSTDNVNYAFPIDPIWGSIPGNEYTELNKLTAKNPIIIYSQLITLADKVDYSTGVQDHKQFKFEYTDNTNEDVTLNWFIAETQESYHSTGTFTLEEDFNIFTLQLIAETNYVEITSTNNTYNNSFNFPCTQEECTYGLPGSPPYTITNEYPHLYDLYFVNGSQDEDEYLITGTTTFNTDGNIRAKKLSKQVLYTADAVDSSFWGCSAGALIPTYIYNSTDHDYSEGENLPQCSIKGSYYCAYQDDDFLINSWSQSPIEQYGYEDRGEYDGGNEFEPAKCEGDQPCSATDRNHSTSVVPGRNFIPNPSFAESHGDDLSGWELLNTNTNQFNPEEDEHISDNTITVQSSHSFRTEKIALMQNEEYFFSNEGSCSPSITLVNADGFQSNALTSFDSGSNIYVVISFEGSCTLSNPMLQLIDDNPLGINSYNSPEDYILTEDAPSIMKGAACCPDSWCWNGFMCVESMDQTTYLHEDINNRTYRCIAGEWSYLDPKFDWNHEEWGFCNSVDQCFVTSSLSEGADPSATPEDFYNGEYSTCINNTQYIFDHYCNAGTWVSRTSFLVSSLLTYAENDDYVLSCDRPQNNLLNYDDPGYGYKNYIIGSSSAEITNLSSFTDALNGTPTHTSTVDVCFNSIDISETGKRLVPTDENTCINNVCVLKYNSNGEFKTAFGTSMNLLINDSNSFLVPLEVATGATADDFCIEEISSSDQFVTCNENLKYSSRINSLIYSKEELSISTSVFSKATEWFKDFFTGDEDEETEDFLANSVNYNKVYLTSLNDDQYIIRSVEDVTPTGRRILSEYSGFDINVCDYVLNINEDYVYDPLFPDVPEPLVTCNVSDDENTYLVSAGAYTDFWWPQLTGMLRVPNE